MNQIVPLRHDRTKIPIKILRCAQLLEIIYGYNIQCVNQMTDVWVRQYSRIDTADIFVSPFHSFKLIDSDYLLMLIGKV